MAIFSLLAGAELSFGETEQFSVAGYESIEVIVGPTEYVIDETIYLWLAITSGTLGTYLSVQQTGDDWTLTAMVDCYIHDVVGQQPVTEPDAPAVPTVSGIQRFQVTISWIEPDDNNADISSYDLEWRQGSTGSWTEVSNITSTSHTLTGLDHDTAYQVRVRATNSEGDSDYSTAVSFTTAVNQAPTVTINTSSQTINGNSTLVLDASATDPESDDLTIAWSADLGTFTDGATLAATYNAPAPTVASQTATLTLTVTDPYEGETARTLELTIGVELGTQRHHYHS